MLDEVSLKSADKRMAKILVEVDVHAGLMEVLEIEWRGLVFIQRLDYLGIPFRCTLCRRTGHLRKECTNIYGSLADEDSMEDTQQAMSHRIDEASDTLDYPGLSSEDNPTTTDSTFVGKLKHYCPNLYFSLSVWERDHLNSILFPDQFLRKGQDLEKSPLDSENMVMDGERTMSPVGVSPRVSPRTLPLTSSENN
jgi:hypothetical protein